MEYVKESNIKSKSETGPIQDELAPLELDDAAFSLFDKAPIVPDWKKARQGIDLFINNHNVEAEKFFGEHLNSLTMTSGYSFLMFINAIMSFEDDKITFALNKLRDVELKCSNNVGWVQSVKYRMFGGVDENMAKKIENQLILADTQVCIAILTFLQQEFSGYIRGGWVLRRAWKTYQQVYNQLWPLYCSRFGDDVGDINFCFYKECDSKQSVFNRTNGNNNNNNNAALSFRSSCTTANFQCLTDDSDIENNVDDADSTRSSLLVSAVKQSISYPFGFLTNLTSTVSRENLYMPSEKYQCKVSDHDLRRLMTAASFGYGVFQLSVSLLPPTMIKLTQLFGFAADRNVGLQSLMFSRQGDDMHAPLASLALLWYHTIVRPFFALDGCNVHAGVCSASEIIDESSKNYAQSALFLFFRGRISRLQSQIPDAIRHYQQAIENCNHHELKILSLHEIAWCHLIQLDYIESNATFTMLKQRSRWSKTFYAYLEVICAGAGDILNDVAIVDDLLQMLESDLGRIPAAAQLETYLSRRVKLLPRSNILLSSYSVINWKLLVYELLYLWNALPSCSGDTIQKILKDCSNAVHEPFPGLARFICGCCNNILGNLNLAQASFRQSLDQSNNVSNKRDNNFLHITALAQFELSVLLLKDSETIAEGKTLLKKVLTDYRDYDFDTRLNVRATSLLKKMSCN